MKGHAMKAQNIPVAAKRQSAKEMLMEKLTQMIDKTYDGMTDEEIRASQGRLRIQRDRVRASRARKRETA